MIIKKKLNINSENALKIIEIINEANAEARFVGGCVRDNVINKQPKDIDISTNLKPEEVMSLLSKSNIKTIPTGIKYGTITAIFHNEVIEITTLREDIKCDGRKAEVVFSDSFYEDAKRRDFTINALSYCPQKQQLYDYFGGLDDLQNQVVKFIGSASERVKEDYLRILRFFRFSQIFAKNLDQESLQACIQYKDHLAALSKERIKSEMDLILSSVNSEIVEVMHREGMLAQLFSELTYDHQLHIKLIEAAKTYKCKDNLRFLLYAAIFRQQQDDLPQKLLDLRFAKHEIKLITKLAQLFHQDFLQLAVQLRVIFITESLYPLFFAILSTITNDHMLVEDEFMKCIKYKNKPVFPINGRDLLKMGFVNKDVGIIINKLFHLWAKSEFTLSKDNLIKYI